MYFPHKASGVIGLAASTLFLTGLGSLSAMATIDPEPTVTTIQETTRYFCVLPGVEGQVVRCVCPAGDGVGTPPWLRKPEQGPAHFTVLPGQGGKTLVSPK
ncbi:hypothetical protein GCM10009715_23350 [Paeniglutamicibacter psychrophenolicus]|uniref:Uncharacterized protein n=1 Tax=Paeniglutamicibacter psychrophenolicus TaxID=257454 RepID=A0ABS4WHU1_9MICC|nr:hypothetical protein [Paeniglutamicibacter psychrophenolicus]